MLHMLWGLGDRVGNGVLEDIRKGLVHNDMQIFVSLSCQWKIHEWGFVCYQYGLEYH